MLYNGDICPYHSTFYLRYSNIKIEL